MASSDNRHAIVDSAERSLELLLGPLLAYEPGRDPPLPETSVGQISDDLRRMGQVTWSRIPRIYAVLRLINEVHAIDAFISRGISDLWFPFSHQTLPDALRSPTSRFDFLEKQKFVLTKALDLEREDGKHRHFSRADDIPLRKLEELGKGGFGYVDRVLSTITHKEYARKLIPRGRTFKKNAEVLREYERELAHLKKLSHPHIVELIGSYTDLKYVGILMYPVAQYNLKEFLDQSSLTREHRSFLRTFFGCLAAAVSYLHDQRIRHKDIKPQNVLVKDHLVFLTDFGISIDWSDYGQATTTGVAVKTPRYCAPEVASSLPRNYLSDLWSLGCVFLEIWTVLKGATVEQLVEYLENNGTRSKFYYANHASSIGWCQSLKDSSIGTIDEDPPCDWIEGMLQADQSARWTALHLCNQIQEANDNPDLRYAFSGQCCILEDDYTNSTLSSNRNSANFDNTGVSSITAFVPKSMPSSKPSGRLMSDCDLPEISSNSPQNIETSGELDLPVSLIESPESQQEQTEPLSSEKDHLPVPHSRKGHSVAKPDTAKETWPSLREIDELEKDRLPLSPLGPAAQSLNISAGVVTDIPSLDSWDIVGSKLSQLQPASFEATPTFRLLNPEPVPEQHPFNTEDSGVAYVNPSNDQNTTHSNGAETSQGTVEDIDGNTLKPSNLKGQELGSGTLFTPQAAVDLASESKSAHTELSQQSEPLAPVQKRLSLQDEFSTAPEEAKTEAPATTAFPNKLMSNQLAETFLGSAKSTAKKIRCDKCHEVCSGYYVRALGGFFHLECFTCADCGEIVASKFFQANHNDKVPLCETDYFRRLDLLCAACGQSLRGDYINAINGKFHPDHFTCSVCSMVLKSEDRYYEHNNNSFCHFDYCQGIAKPCAGCGAPILAQFFTPSGNEHWHPECYKIYKKWGLRINNVDFPAHSVTQTRNNPPSDQDRTDLKRKIAIGEERIRSTWTTLSSFEAQLVTCLKECSSYFGEKNIPLLLVKLERLVLLLNLLLRAIDSLKVLSSELDAKGPLYHRDVKLLRMKTNLLMQSVARPVSEAPSNEEFMSHLNAVARHFKRLLRNGLRGSLDLESKGTDKALTRFLVMIENADTKTNFWFLTNPDEVSRLCSETANTCSVCQKPVESECLVVSFNQRIHANCFRCAYCGEFQYNERANATVYVASGSCSSCGARLPNAGHLISYLEQNVHLLKVALARLATTLQWDPSKHEVLVQAIAESEQTQKETLPQERWPTEEFEPEATVGTAGPYRRRSGRSTATVRRKLIAEKPTTTPSELVPDGAEPATKEKDEPPQYLSPKTEKKRSSFFRFRKKSPS